MDEERIEAHAIDERLERRAGRALGARHVELAEGCSEVGAAELRAHAPAVVLDHHHRDRSTLLDRLAADEVLDAALEPPVERGAELAAGCGTRGKLGGEVRGEEGECRAALGDRLGECLCHLDGAQAAACAELTQDLVPRVPRRVRMEIGPHPLGRLGKCYEECRLAGRQAARLLAEIGERGGAHALEIAAEGGERQVDREDLRLGVTSLELERAQHLERLAEERARPRRQQACRLHGQRRAARDDVARGEPLPERARERSRIDAPMGGKALVLVSLQHREIKRVDVPGRRLRRQA